MKRKPIYLLAGGHWRKPEALVPVLKTILADSGRARPRVANLGAANGDDAGFFKFTGDLLKAAGAGAVTPVRLAAEQADVGAARALLSAADAVFVSGGDVAEGMRWIHRHRLAPFLRGLQRKGMLFFGVSAGSIMLGTKWIRWTNPKDDASAELFDCLGLAPLLCDTHEEKDGWPELKAAVRLLGEKGQGYGIPTGGVLRVGGDGAVSALVKPADCFSMRAKRVVKCACLIAP